MTELSLRWAFHMPGEAPVPFAKGTTEFILELHDSDARLLVSSTCRRPADRGRSAVYEDFQEVLPWFDNAAVVVLVRDRKELVRWPVDGSAPERRDAEITVTPARRDDGADVLRVALPARRDEKGRHYMLRYSPDDGHTWIPLANNVNAEGMEMAPELFRGLGQVKFQLAVASGFRTTLVEAAQPAEGSRMARSLEIVMPAEGTRFKREDSVSLMGTAPTPLDGSPETVVAYWSSNRDGFLADGLRAKARSLSVGRHVLRLTVEDAGGEMSKTVVIWVDDAGASAILRHGTDDPFANSLGDSDVRDEHQCVRAECGQRENSGQREEEGPVGRRKTCGGCSATGQYRRRGEKAGPAGRGQARGRRPAARQHQRRGEKDRS
jgi:hypothetical protein